MGHFKNEAPSGNDINKKLIEIIEASEEAIIETDNNGVITSWNNGAERIYGYTKDEILGKGINLLFLNGKDEFFNDINRLKNGQLIKDTELKRAKKDGNEAIVNVTIIPINDDNDNLIGILSIERDIKKDIEKDEVIKEANNKFKAFVENLPGFAFVKDKDSRALILSKQFEKYFNMPVSNIIGKKNDEYWSPSDAEKMTKDDLQALKLNEGEFLVSEEYLIINDKDIVLETYKFPIVQSNGDKLVAGLSIDITDRKNMERKIRHIAYHDELTGLTNRAFFNLNFENELKCIKESKKSGTVFFIDLDNFKYINDTYGHTFGDQTLCCIADRLKQYVTDDFIVSRFVGDEFVVLSKNIADRKEAEKVARKLLNILSEPIEVCYKKIFLTASIGISMYPSDGYTIETILQNVDAAMYSAKEHGRNTFRFFETALYESILYKTRLETALRQALANKELYLNYQPLVDSKSMKILGVEALLRWNNPVMGNVSPAEFIPYAEETGIIISIGEWVLREACKQNKLWHDKGYKDIVVAVNISDIQLRQENFAIDVRNILSETGLDPIFLEIEITESKLMESMSANVKILEELKKLGIKISLDDFGTGYSSLNYLKALPIDTVKIDKSFIDNICTNSNENAITEGIIFLAHRIGLNVTAEGVELKEQYELLNDEECDKIQGYIFSRPVLAEKVEELILKGSYDLDN